MGDVRVIRDFRITNDFHVIKANGQFSASIILGISEVSTIVITPSCLTPFFKSPPCLHPFQVSLLPQSPLLDFLFPLSKVRMYHSSVFRSDFFSKLHSCFRWFGQFHALKDRSVCWLFLSFYLQFGSQICISTCTSDISTCMSDRNFTIDMSKMKLPPSKPVSPKQDRASPSSLLLLQSKPPQFPFWSIVF